MTSKDTSLKSLRGATALLDRAQRFVFLVEITASRMHELDLDPVAYLRDLDSRFESQILWPDGSQTAVNPEAWNPAKPSAQTLKGDLILASDREVFANLRR